MRRLLAGLCLLLLLPAYGAAQVIPGGWISAWPRTDFTRISVDPAEIIAGGPAKDGIPAITAPAMIPAAEETGLDPREPVMVLALEGVAPRAYPVRYLMWHEVVNDAAGGVPVAVTFCPLCNSGLIFDRRIDGGILEFGVSGMLRHSDLIMFDRQTESWWQQFEGRAIVGHLLGTELAPLPALLQSWKGFREGNPDGLVMAKPRGHRRPYGTNPYAGYDGGQPMLYRGELPPVGIEPLIRVVRVGNRAWPLPRLAGAGEIAEAGYRLTWRRGQASALDTERIADGREVGDVQVLDAATGAPVVHEVVFAFAFHAFEPQGIWMLGE